MKRDRRRLRLSLAVYAVLLRLYPSAFRRRFADEMRDVFQQQLQQASRDRGWFGVAATWGRTIAELPLTAWQQHALERQKEPAMIRRISKPLEIHLALLAAMILAALLTPADPMSMLVLTLPLLAAYACLRSSTATPALWRWSVVGISLLPPAFLVALGGGLIPLGHPSWSVIALLVLGPLAISLATLVATLTVSRRLRAHRPA